MLDYPRGAAATTSCLAKAIDNAAVQEQNHLASWWGLPRGQLAKQAAECGRR